MTMGNIPGLVVLGVGALGSLHVFVAAGLYVAGRLREHRLARRAGKSLAVGAVGTFLLYVALVLLWITVYDSNRELGARIGHAVLASTPLAVVLPSGAGIFHFYASDR